MKKEKIDKKLLFKNLKSMWKYLKPEKKLIVEFVILSIMQTAVGVIFPLISAKIVLYLTDGLFAELLLTSVIIFGINIISSIIDYFIGYANDRINNSSTNRLQIDFAKEFLKLQIAEIDKSSTGKFSEMINSDVSTMNYIFFSFSYQVTNILSKIGTVVTIFILNKYVFVYYLIVAIIMFLLGEIRNKIQEKHWKKMRDLRAEKNSLITELVRGIRDIKVLNAINPVINKVTTRIKNLTEEDYIGNKQWRIFNIINQLIRGITEFCFFLLGISLCNNGLLTISTFLILYNYRSSMSYIFTGITNLSSNLREFNVSAEKVFGVINGIEIKKENFGTKKLKKVNGNIEFKNVSFSYDNKNKVIKDMSFKINSNEVVGFVGKSGAGKTTIFSLITRLYDVDEGEILIDGINIYDLDEKSLRNNMSIITQNPYIFDFSIKDNLLLANPKATMKEIREACKLACIDEYIMELDDKYETKLGENGIILSGGQKQRLAIARALLTKTEILLFDEATSALDNNTQEEIQKSIKNLKGKYTILIIAHRLSTVLDSDKIFVIDNGKIVGEGTHKELIKSNNTYKKLYQKEAD